MTTDETLTAEEVEGKDKKRMAELEKENAELKESYYLRRCKHCKFLHENGNCLKVGGFFTAVDNKDCPILKDKVELIKENAELKCECRRCVYTDSPCTLSDYGKDKDGICDHFKDVFEENAELKHTIAELRRDKDNLNTHTKAQEKLSEYRSDQLNKAKEILHKVCYEFGIYNKDLMKEAKQFLKEVEK